MLHLVLLILVMLVVILGVSAAHWRQRAQKLEAELAALKQKSSAPITRTAEVDRIFSEFEQRRQAAHRDAEGHAQALLDWESEGGRVLEDPEPSDPDDRHIHRLWLDIGGEG